MLDGGFQMLETCSQRGQKALSLCLQVPHAPCCRADDCVSHGTSCIRAGEQSPWTMVPVPRSCTAVLCPRSLCCSSDSKRGGSDPGSCYFVLLMLLKDRTAPICPELLSYNMALQGRSILKTMFDSENVLLEHSMRKTNYYGINEQIHHQRGKRRRELV